MDEYEKFYNNICRVCLKFSDGKSMVSLLDSNSDDGLSCYGQAVSSFAHIEIMSDFMPTMICKQCVKALKTAINFRLSCENNNIVLENLIKKLKSENQSETVVDKKFVMEYLMSKHYFPAQPETLNDDDDDEYDMLSDINSQDIDTSDLCSDTDETESNYSDTSENAMDKKDNEHRSRNSDKRLTHDKTKTTSDSSSKSNVKKNMKIPLGSGPYVCPVCSKVLANPATYKGHIKRMHETLTCICEYCSKAFSNTTELNSHTVTKHGIGNYIECKQCGFKTTKRNLLVDHKRIHTGERPHICHECGLSFRTSQILGRHLKRHLGLKIKCSDCDKTFITTGEMTVHYNNIHERQYVYACEKCDVTYKKLHTVRHHMIKVHNIPRKMQGPLKRVFTMSGAFPKN